MEWDSVLLFIAFILIIAGLIGFAYYSYTENVNECTRDPLKFALSEIKDNYNASRVYGSVSVITPKGMKSWEYGDTVSLDNITKLG